MNISLQNAYDMTDLSGHVHAANTALSENISLLTTRVSSIGQQAERPASLKRRWATRAVAAAAVAALPVVPLALTVGPLAVLAFGVGRDRNQPLRNNALLKSYDLIKAHGVLCLPEQGAVSMGQYAEAKGYDRLYKIAMGLAIGLGAVGNFVRVPMALTATGVLLADGAAQLVSSLVAAVFGVVVEKWSSSSSAAGVAQSA